MMLRYPLRRFSASPTSLIPTYKVAIVGSGPAGFYTAHHLLNKAPKDKFNIKLDFYERLPAPFGLSRYGVAPDHPEVKNCEEYMDNIMANFDQVRFFGNVNIGKDLTINQLEANYHSVVLAYGCVNADNKLNIPGNDLPGVISARQFVNWYNGHPDFYSGDNDFLPPQLDKVKSVTLIGNGNVALDVARILLADPESHWSSTDISAEALKMLQKSKVKHVNIVARRGILESAFTNKEIRELLELNKTKKVKFLPVDDETFEYIQPYMKDIDRVNKRRLSIIDKYSKPGDDYTPEKTWCLQYLKNPKQFIVNENDPNFLSKTIFEKNKIINDDITNKPKIIPDDHAGPVEIENDIVVLSIGYKGSELNGFGDNNILFDESKNRIVNKGGKIISQASSDPKNPIFKNGFYTSGWIKNGPQGVIASTMMDSFDTAENIIQDLCNDIHTNPDQSCNNIESLLSSTKVVSWPSWLNLNKYELDKGELLGKSREKVCQVDKMLEISCK